VGITFLSTDLYTYFFHIFDGFICFYKHYPQLVDNGDDFVDNLCLSTGQKVIHIFWGIFEILSTDLSTIKERL
jgi:hypothetical protein